VRVSGSGAACGCELADGEQVCPRCLSCSICCGCEDYDADERCQDYDADELGLDPEEDYDA